MTLKQNKIYQALLTILLLCSIFSMQAIANQNKPKNIELKCYVELYGGQNIIYFTNENSFIKDDFIKQLFGRMTTSPFFKGKKKIYKAYECVGLNDKFKSAQARKIDKLTPR